jgi:hypothetical protein
MGQFDFFFSSKSRTEFTISQGLPPTPLASEGLFEAIVPYFAGLKSENNAYAVFAACFQLLITGALLMQIFPSWRAVFLY